MIKPGLDAGDVYPPGRPGSSHTLHPSTSPSFVEDPSPLSVVPIYRARARALLLPPSRLCEIRSQSGPLIILSYDAPCDAAAGLRDCEITRHESRPRPPCPRTDSLTAPESVDRNYSRSICSAALARASIIGNGRGRGCIIVRWTLSVLHLARYNRRRRVSSM